MKNLRAITYYDIFEKNARMNGSACALSWDHHTTDYQTLFSQTRSLACGLNQLNLPPGARVAVLCKNHPFFFHLFGAASALNLCLVLMNRRLSGDELSHIVEDTRPTVLFYDEGMAGQAAELAKSAAGIAHLFMVSEQAADFNSLYTQGELSEPLSQAPGDPFAIIHTAAVLGKPRGAVLSQENIILANQQIIQAYDLGPDKTYLNILPLFHIMGVNLGLGTLQAGGRNVIMEKFDAQKALGLITEQKVNIFGSFPPILTQLIDTIQSTPEADHSCLETVVGLEAPDTARQWESKTGSTFWALYGQTETSGIITTSPYFEKAGSAGRITPLATVRTIDEDDRLQSPGQTGEIVLRGPLVFQGYWNAEGVNNHTFRKEWHHTGDLGMIDADGFLFFKGRKPEKELIKPGGENVFPAEVEQVILAHDAVKEVCVFGVPDPKFGEGIKAVCALAPGMALTAEALTEFCAARMAGYKKPRIIEFTQALPRTQDGNIDREQVKQDFS